MGCYSCAKFESGTTKLDDPPTKPFCLSNGQWNGKLYGKQQYGFRIYMANKEISISDDDAIQKYINEKQEYDDKVKAIKAGNA